MIPVQYVHLSGFQGVRDDLDETLRPPAAMRQGLNVRVDSGIVETRGGYTFQAPTGTTPLTLNGDEVIRNLIPLRFVKGASITDELLVIGGNSALPISSTPALTGVDHIFTTSNLLHDWTMYQDKLVLGQKGIGADAFAGVGGGVNTSDKMLTYDGSAWALVPGTVQTVPLASHIRNMSAVTVANGSAGMSAGTVYYTVSANIELESGTIQETGALVEQSVSVSLHDYVSFDWVADERAVSYNLYAGNTSGGSNYTKYVCYKPAYTLTSDPPAATTSAAQTAITANWDKRPALVESGTGILGDYLFIGNYYDAINTTYYPNRVAFTDKLTNWDGTLGANTGIFECGEDDNDYLVGLKEFNGRILAFKRHGKIYYIEGTGGGAMFGESAPISLHQLAYSGGCLGKDTIQVAKGVLYFLSPSGPKAIINVGPTVSPIPLESRCQDLWAAYDLSSPEDITSGYWPDTGEIWWSIGNKVLVFRTPKSGDDPGDFYEFNHAFGGAAYWVIDGSAGVFVTGCGHQTGRLLAHVVDGFDTGYGGEAAIDPTVVNSSTSTTVVVDDLSVADNALVGATIVCVDPDGTWPDNYQQRVITANAGAGGSETITVNAAWDLNPAAGDDVYVGGILCYWLSPHLPSSSAAGELSLIPKRSNDLDLLMHVNGSYDLDLLLIRDRSAAPDFVTLSVVSGGVPLGTFVLDVDALGGSTSYKTKVQHRKRMESLSAGLVTYAVGRPFKLVRGVLGYQVLSRGYL